MEPPWAVVVDRNPASRTLMSEVLEQHGFSVRRVDDPWQTLDTPATRSASLVSLAFESTQDRLDSLIERLAQLEPRPLIVGVGDPGSTLSTELASELYDLVPAPIGRAALERMVRRCKTRLALVKRLERLQEELKHRHGFSGFVGRGDAMRRVRSELERLSVTDDPVWISGEPGTGKESAARQLHATSPRRESEFVPIDCTELSRVADVLPTSGEFPRGEGGTLYLAELPALRPDLQEELLRTVGMLRARGIRAPRGVRLVVGSRLDPTRAGSEGRLLPELQRQLSTHAIAIPPLRERREEIVLLADHFLSQICEINRLRRIHLGHETIARLESYPWPGNVEQLRAAIEQAAIVARGDVIEPEDLPSQVRESRQSTPTGAAADRDPSKRPFRDAKRDVVEVFERGYLGALLERHAGNVTAASQQAGMLRSALQRLLRKYGLKSAEFRKGRRPGVRAVAGESPDRSR